MDVAFFGVLTTLFIRTREPSSKYSFSWEYSSSSLLWVPSWMLRPEGLNPQDQQDPKDLEGLGSVQGLGFRVLKPQAPLTPRPTPSAREAPMPMLNPSTEWPGSPVRSSSRSKRRPPTFAMRFAQARKPLNSLIPEPLSPEPFCSPKP